MKKALIIAIALIIIGLFNQITEIYASDREVVCNSGGCSGFDGSLFSELDLKPGDTYERSFCVKNERDENLEVVLSAEERSDSSGILKNILEIDLLETGANHIFLGNLKDFFSSEIDLGRINEGNEKCYELDVYFPHDAGNIYQDKSVTFDLALRITGEETGDEEVLSSTSTSSDANSENTGLGNVLGSVLGLSDTAAAIFEKHLGYLIFGILFTTAGLKLILQRKRII